MGWANFNPCRYWKVLTDARTVLKWCSNKWDNKNRDWYTSLDSVSMYTQATDSCWAVIYSAPNGATAICSLLVGFKLSLMADLPSHTHWACDTRISTKSPAHKYTHLKLQHFPHNLRNSQSNILHSRLARKQNFKAL